MKKSFALFLIATFLNMVRTYLLITKKKLMYKFFVENEIKNKFNTSMEDQLLDKYDIYSDVVYSCMMILLVLFIFYTVIYSIELDGYSFPHLMLFIVCMVFVFVIADNLVAIPIGYSLTFNLFREIFCIMIQSFLYLSYALIPIIFAMLFRNEFKKISLVDVKM